MNGYQHTYNAIIVLSVLIISMTGFIVMNSASGLYSIAMMLFCQTEGPLFDLKIKLSDEDKKDGDLSK